MTADAESLPTPANAATTGASRGRRTMHLLLAPILATAAVGVHWFVNVPAGGAKVSAKDQGAEKAAAKPKKPKKPKKRPGFEPRPPGEVEATYLRFADTPFADEAVKSTWARPHQTLVNQAVTTARTAAFEGAPEEPRVSVDDVTCRTVRCQFVLRGPFAHEVDLLSETLSRLQLGGVSIWRLYQAEKIAPPKPDQPKGDTYLLVTVSFVEDSMDNSKFTVPQEIGGGAEDDEDAAKAADDDEPTTED